MAATAADEIAAAKRESPDRVFVVTYERLVAESEQTMRAIAEWLAIDWTRVAARAHLQPASDPG